MSHRVLYYSVNQSKKIVRIYICSAGAFLLIASIAKLVSACGNSKILQNLDPIFSIPFRDILWIVGSIELVVVSVCFFCKQALLQVALTAWLATCFMLYRVGLLWIDYRKPCHCLGNLTDALHIPPQTADTAMKIILLYLLIGSYATLFWLWRQKRKSSSVSSSEKAVGSAS